MTTIREPDLPRATDGEIAAINLEGARRHTWMRFAQYPLRPSLAETILDQERTAAQFLGDIDALDRLEILATQLVAFDTSHRIEMICAEIASAGHRFVDARRHLAHAARVGAPLEEIERRRLTIDQACGVDLEAVLDSRRRIAATIGQLEDLVPLGALLAELEHFDEADAIYRHAFRAYNNVSPFPLAWVCFQLGILWGELVPEPEPQLAALWYQCAIDYLPGYARARVHLAEIYARQDRAAEAEELLRPALSSCDPEVTWRLADMLFAQERFEEAETHLAAARFGFENLLEKHLLAFADHAAEFYAGSGNNYHRALELAQINAANRPTPRAVKRAAELAGKCR